MASPTRIVLASSSRYRQQLISQLGIQAECHAPNIDETPLNTEKPAETALRLARQKAAHVATQHKDALVIGSDQVADLDGIALGKPGDRDQTIEQLQACSGKTLHFHTGLCLINSQSGRQQNCVETFTVHFRPLTTDQITRYVDKEPAFDCAGGFKMEGLGISLFERLSGDDPNTLIGLPLIRLVDFLTKEGYALP
ncbi:MULTISPECIES: Maf family protein [Spongiibacter]|uniref:Maf family protein n=1 Tax=Spongiibacter TaxID=630749 RepID=UPI000C0A2F4D|nr:Maf family protein [Spongiibacter sp.]MAK43926.1 septum formation inhibitor Maf [Spongiibacter sp.]|tara:strand:+ start:159 stop:746 length:588 start_codon:yes stop_codon:yes gene_type:complete